MGTHESNNSYGVEDCGHLLGQGAGYARKWNDVPCYLRSSWYRNRYPVILCEKKVHLGRPAPSQHEVMEVV